jgi:predicted Zn-dependent peptidase
LASTLSMLAGAGLDETWLRDHPANLAAVTVDEVAHAAATMLAPANFTGVVVGDIGMLESQLHGLGNVRFA